MLSDRSNLCTTPGLNDIVACDAPSIKNLPPDTFMLNVGIVSTKLLKEVGGWDCCFEVCPCSYNDLAIC